MDWFAISPTVPEKPPVETIPTKELILENPPSIAPQGKGCSTVLINK